MKTLGSLFFGLVLLFAVSACSEEDVAPITSDDDASVEWKVKSEEDEFTPPKRS